MGRWVRVTTAALASALWLSSSCGGQSTVSATEARCRRLCEDSKACLSAEEARRVECFGSCDDLEALNRGNECYDEADSYYDCVEKRGVCADLDTECAEPQDVYSDCLSDQCSTDPDRDICL